MAGTSVRLVHVHHVWDTSKTLFSPLFFTSCQVSAIWYDETGIESLKKEEVGLCELFRVTLNLIVGKMGEEIEVEEYTG